MIEKTGALKEAIGFSRNLVFVPREDVP